jgi:hypothetical protein
MTTMASDQDCPYCGGKGSVYGVVGDVEFIFQCSCVGGSEEAVRWLLDLPDEPPDDPPSAEPSTGDSPI